jgi:hypothetical protein
VPLTYRICGEFPAVWPGVRRAAAPQLGVGLNNAQDPADSVAVGQDRLPGLRSRGPVGFWCGADTDREVSASITMFRRSNMRRTTCQTYNGALCRPMAASVTAGTVEEPSLLD